MVGEALAVRDKRAGDTFSEFMRKLYSGKPYRVALIVGMTGYLMAAMAAMFTSHWWEWQLYRVAGLFGLVFVWLIPHWLSDGSKG